MSLEPQPRKKIFFSFLVASLLHFAFLYTLHLTPLNSSLNIDSQFGKAFFEISHEKFLRDQRSIELGHIFANIQKTPSEIKEQFYDLTYEFSPPPLVSFPEGEPLIVNNQEFSLSKTLIDLPNPKNESIGIKKGASLVTHSPHCISHDLPIRSSTQFLETCDPEKQMIDGESFEIHVEYTHKRERPGYVFKLTLTPKAKPHFKRIAQNYYFLIDRSNSIPRGRFLLNKKMVASALHHLKPGDGFNIFLFDDRVVKLSEHPLEWNQENLIKGSEFLDKQQHGGYFAATELYSSLGKVLPADPDKEKMHTAILLSDGDTYLPLEKQRQTLGGWTLQNGGQIALFSATSGGGNNLPLLELISLFNKGILLYSPDPLKMEERFIDLIKMIRSPIGQDLSLTALTTDSQMSIRLQPKQHCLPHLYLNRPYVVYGSTNRLSDFILFIQGTAAGSPIDLQKRVSFKNANTSSPDLEKKWVQLIAYDHYYNFLKEGNHKHLEVAKRLLQPYKIPMPLQDDVHHKR